MSHTQASLEDSTKHLQEELTPILLNLFQKMEKEGTFLNSLHEDSIILIPKQEKETKRKPNKTKLQINILTNIKSGKKILAD